MAEKSERPERLQLAENQVVVLGVGGFAYVQTLTQDEHVALTALEARRASPPRQANPPGWSEWEW